jgi:hypothetical protein
MEQQKLIKRLNFLTVHAILSTIIVLLLSYFQFSGTNSGPTYNANYPLDSLTIRQLRAERIDIVEPTGNLAISLSNSRTTPLPRWDGVKLRGASNRESPNIIFFDGKGDEIGGINFSNNSENGDAIRHLAFDGFKQDEVITLSHFIQNGKSRKGIYIYDRPNVEILDALEEMGISANDNESMLRKKIAQFKNEYPNRFDEIWYDRKRVALQTNENKDAEMILSDTNGQVRLRLLVTERENAIIEFFDQNGDLVKQIKADN